MKCSSSSHSSRKRPSRCAISHIDDFVAAMETDGFHRHRGVAPTAGQTAQHATVRPPLCLGPMAQQAALTSSWRDTSRTRVGSTCSIKSVVSPARNSGVRSVATKSLGSCVSPGSRWFLTLAPSDLRPLCGSVHAQSPWRSSDQTGC